MKGYNKMMYLLCVLCLTWFNASVAMAQTKVADKEIIGVWKLTMLMYEGEDENLVNESYSQVKVFRANGEYACAEIVKMGNGNYKILPHEYGTYTLKNGMYSEMGRNALKHGWINKTTFGGRWKNTISEWKKVTNMPEKLTQFIVHKCKVAQQDSKEMQQLMKQYIFK